MALAVVVGVWAYGAITAYDGLFAASNLNRRVWVAAWLLCWAGLGLRGLSQAGRFVMRELVDVDARSITIRRELAGVGRSHRFVLGDIRNLHFAVPPPVGSYPPPSRGWPPLPTPLLAGSIRFQTDSRTHEFGLGLGWPDMEAVLAGVREWVPVASGASQAD
jgi:hypothetical protein